MRRPGPERALLSLQLRLWSSATRQWLFSLGFMPDRDATALGYIYALYALALGLGWLGASWGGLVTLTLQVSGSLAPALRADLGHAVPLIVGLWLAVLLVISLLSGTIRLSATDVSFLRGMRLPRSTLAALRSLPPALAQVAVALPVGTVLSVLSTGSPGHYIVAMVAAVPIVMGGFALAWAVGMLRLSTPKAGMRAALWLVPAAYIAALLAGSPLILWPGRAFARVALSGALPLFGLVAWLLAGVLLLLLSASWIQPTLLADAGLLRSLLRSIDAGRRWNPAVAAQQRRAAVLSRRRPTLQLSAAEGTPLLAMRVMLALVRYPSSLWSLLRTVMILLGGLDLAILRAQGDAWLMWTLIVFVYPPLPLVEGYAADMLPMWRQFIGIAPLRVLLADALLPAGVVALIGLVEILLLHFAPARAAEAFLLLLGLLALATLSQALRDAPSDVPAARLPVPDILASVIGYGLFVGLGVVLHAVLGAAIALLVLSAGLSQLLRAGRAS